MANPEDTTEVDNASLEEAPLPQTGEENVQGMDSSQSGEASSEEETAEPSHEEEQKKPSQEVKEPVAKDPQQQLESVSSTPPALEIALSFLLGHQSIPLQEVKSLVEGKVISLGGSQFQASIMLQEKIIAQAQLVMVEGVPSLQITKTMNGS